VLVSNMSCKLSEQLLPDSVEDQRTDKGKLWTFSVSEVDSTRVLLSNHVSPPSACGIIRSSQSIRFDFELTDLVCLPKVSSFRAPNELIEPLSNSLNGKKSE
jgi:hypothetical protein